MRTAALVVAIALALAGCLPSTMGHPIDAARVQEFQAGVTTRAQAEAVLGPASTESMDGSDTLLLWSFSENVGNQFKPEYRTRIVQLRFGPDGVIKDLYDVPRGRGAARAGD